MSRRKSAAAIARILGKHRASICRELARNTTEIGIYYEKFAQTKTRNRRKAAKASQIVIDNDMQMEMHIESFLKRHLSPEQIAGYMRRSGYPRAVCHKTIYAWVHRKWQSRKAYLRFKGRPRIPYGVRKRSWQPQRRHISERPRIVEKRVRAGDWEGDLVHGTKDDSRHALLTLNDRASGFCIIRKVTTLSPFPMAHIIATALKDLPVHTITFDNGIEFGQHKTIEKLLTCKVYFTDTHAPEQRGSNENLNGLIREFFPKGVSLAHVTQFQASQAAADLNARPRKRLGYDCPRRVFASLAGTSSYFMR